MKFWLSNGQTWVDEAFIQQHVIEGELLLTDSDNPMYYKATDAGFGLGWYMTTREEYLLLGGTFPEEIKEKEVNRPKLPVHELGDILEESTLTKWAGYATVWQDRTGLYDIRDREGKLWRRVGRKYRLQVLADGTEFPGLAKRNLTEGDLIFQEDLVEARYTRSNLYDPETRQHNYYKPNTPEVVFLFNKDSGMYSYHVFSPEVLRLTDEEYLTVEQARTGKYHNVMWCAGNCNRIINNTKDKKSTCHYHGVCTECMAKGVHVHCAGCKQSLDNDQGCPVCHYCWDCRRECVYCPPNAAGKWVCMTCCKGEHYEDAEKEWDRQAENWIQPYGSRQYPPARPPFPKLTEKCKNCERGTIQQNGRMQICGICSGTGMVPDKIEQKKPKPLWIGVELEVEVPTRLHEAAERIWKLHNKDVILKHDSSLRHGFEIVTAPLSLEEHAKMWPVLSDTVLKAGCRSWKYTNTGIHTHTNRDFYTPDEICKLNIFINHPDVKPQIVKIAGRESKRYANLHAKTMADGVKKPFNVERDHREALNVNLDHTIELRVFKGTVALEHILADVQFMHAAAHWIKQAAEKNLGKWEMFWEYVMRTPDQYREMIDHYNRQTTIEKSKEDKS